MRLAALIALLTVVNGCGREVGQPVAHAEEHAPPAPAAPAPEVALPARGPSPDPTRPMLGTTHLQDVILARLHTARVVRFKPVGATSVVYQMKLEGDIDAAFEPATRDAPRGPQAEVAAYRVARLLGLDNVPPAVTRRVSRSHLRDRLHPDFADAWPDLVDATRWDADGSVTGVAIYWVPNLRRLGLERPGAMRRWTRALHQGGELSRDDRALHADLSKLVAFDYLIGNPHRWTGHDAHGTPDGRRVFALDNDAAFGPLREPLHIRLRTDLQRTERLSRSFFERLARMTEPALRAELARDPGADRGLSLTAAELRGVMQRRRTLLSYAASLVDAHGEARAFEFE